MEIECEIWKRKRKFALVWWGASQPDSRVGRHPIFLKFNLGFRFAEFFFQNTSSYSAHTIFLFFFLHPSLFFFLTQLALLTLSVGSQRPSTEHSYQTRNQINDLLFLRLTFYRFIIQISFAAKKNFNLQIIWRMKNLQGKKLRFFILYNVKIDKEKKLRSSSWNYFLKRNFCKKKIKNPKKNMFYYL